MNGLAADGKLYGIPVFLCGNFLIYDRSCDALAKAERITDLANESEVLVINSVPFVRGRGIRHERRQRASV